MVVVVVAYEDGVNGRQVLEVQPGRGQAHRSDEGNGRDPAAEHGVGQNVQPVHLNEKRGVSDPGDLDGVRVGLTDTGQVRFHGLRFEDRRDKGRVDGRGIGRFQADQAAELGPDGESRLGGDIDEGFLPVVGRCGRPPAGELEGSAAGKAENQDKTKEEFGCIAEESAHRRQRNIIIF